MKKSVVYGLGLIAVLGLGTVAAYPAYGQYLGGGGVQTATPEQLEECKQLGIPEFTCTEQTILAKKRLTAAGQAGAYGSGTPMLGTTFGDLGILVGALGAIFGGVAAAFFAMSRRKKGETVRQ